MGYWKTVTAALLLSIFLPAAAWAAPIPIRGVVEGFYGTPWTMKDRADLLKFCGEHGLNAYLYAPKDDPYHRAKWREPYPKKKLKELADLVKTAKEHRVKFIFAVSPGLDLHYTILKGSRDRRILREKMEALYGIGVRDFAVFFDDINELEGKGQAELLDWLEDNFVKSHGDVSPLITVPTEYYRKNMVDEKGNVKTYTAEFSKGLKDDILVLYTGDGVVCQGITEEQLAQANQICGRELGIWWNYPVTDYMEAKLALGPVENLPRQGNVPAIFFNPMKYEQLSKIALATGADYARDPEGYNPQASWERAIEEQYGKLSGAMKVFAAQSQHLENNWANVGRPDGEKLRSAMDDLWASWPKGAHAEKNWGRVRDQVMEIYRASDRLLRRLPEEKLRECRPQLQQMKRIAEADGCALDLLRNMKPGQEKVAADLYDDLKKKRREIQRNEKKALISDKAARAFVDEVLDYVDGIREDRDGKK